MARWTVAFVTPLYFAEESYLGGGERYPLNLARGVVAQARGTVRIVLISFGAVANRIALECGIELVLTQVTV